MTESGRDRWLSIAQSVLLHGTLLGLLVFGWWHFRHKTTPQTLSIDATVVDARTLKGIGFARPVPQPQPKPKPVAPPPTPVPQGPPMPTPQEQALRAQAAQAEAEHQEQVHEEQLKRQAEKQQAALEAQAAQKAEQTAKEKAAQAEARRARRLAEEKQLAEQKKRAQEKKLAAERALAAKVAAEQAAEQKAARAAALAEMQRNMQQEEQNDAQAQAAMADWASVVKQRVEAAWIRPQAAGDALSCTVSVRLVQGGGVADVSIGQCNGNAAVRQSIEAAVYRAAPLPPPPDPSMYQEQLNFVFAPDSQ